MKKQTKIILGVVIVVILIAVAIWYFFFKKPSAAKEDTKPEETPDTKFKNAQDAATLKVMNNTSLSQTQKDQVKYIINSDAEVGKNKAGILERYASGEIVDLVEYILRDAENIYNANNTVPIKLL